MLTLQRSAVALKPAAQSTVPSPSKEDQDTLGRPSASAVDEVVKGYFRMVAPPERKESGESDKDIERYEKTRTITMGKVRGSMLRDSQAGTKLTGPDSTPQLCHWRLGLTDQEATERHRRHVQWR